jgi:microcystin-dependent protein
MEGTLGEIRMFTGNFEPLYWMFCRGQILSIANYSALYAIVGNIYGGDGQTTFQLPNLSSRIAIGAGQGSGLTGYQLGEMVGTEGVTLLVNEMPLHNHAPAVQPGSGGASASITLYGVNDNTSGATSLSGNYMGKDTDAGTSTYVNGNSKEFTKVAMNNGAIQVNNLHAPLPNITLQANGNSQPHSNIQPVLAVNFIICIEGVFPSRN